MKGYLLVNFGGPRNLKEIGSFLRALLTDEEVIRPFWPGPLHKWLFSYIAKKRAKTVIPEYQEIGGKSPIYEDTENLARALEEKLDAPCFTFHRYLPSTHKVLLSFIERPLFKEIIVFPLFPQFSYSTTGSIARFFQEHLSKECLNKLRWVKSYPSHPAFVSLWQGIIKEFLEEKHLKESECVFLFSAHGLPEKFIQEGDPYEVECRLSVERIMKAFPEGRFRLAFQSQFGKAKWLDPSTMHMCETVETWREGRRHIVFVPISFTSDHIETLYEIEKSYMPQIAKSGLTPHRLSACAAHTAFPQTIFSILNEFTPLHTSMLVRKSLKHKLTLAK